MRRPVKLSQSEYVFKERRGVEKGRKLALPVGNATTDQLIRIATLLQVPFFHSQVP
jgi:hypothetical protein